MEAVLPPEGPALALLELCSIARGILCCDAMLKRAPVQLLEAGSIHPGKYRILIKGGVDEIKEALAAGRRAASDALIDDLLLPYPHKQLSILLEGSREAQLESLGILETYSVASIIKGADAALKASEVEGLRLRLAQDLGGKGIFIFTGILHDLEAAMAAALEVVSEGLLAAHEILPNPRAEVLEALD